MLEDCKRLSLRFALGCRSSSYRSGRSCKGIYLALRILNRSSGVIVHAAKA